MVLNKYDILATLPKKSNEGKGHPNCKECGFQSCVVFAMKVEKGKTLLSECPYVNYDAFDQTKKSETTTIDLSYSQQPSEKSKKNTEKQLSHQASDISTGLMISNNNIFVKKLNLLKNFSRQLPKEINLSIDETERGLFSWFGHTVTKVEFNRLTEGIQYRMIEQNKAMIKVVQEIGSIYDTFTALDKVYVQEIVIAINTAFKAIDEARFNNEKLREQQKDISGAQQDIKQVINQQKKIIQVLKSFKEKLEMLKHLYDIDKTFDEVHAVQTKVETFEKALDEQRTDIIHLFETQKEFADRLLILQSADETLSKNLVQSVQKTEQQFCEFEQAAENRNNEFIKNCSSFEALIKKCEQATQDFYSGVNLEIDQITANSGKQFEEAKNELTALRAESGTLLKSFALYKCISIASLASSLVLLILFLIEVLR